MGVCFPVFKDYTTFLERATENHHKIRPFFAVEATVHRRQSVEEALGQHVRDGKVVEDDNDDGASMLWRTWSFILLFPFSPLHLMAGFE